MRSPSACSRSWAAVFPRAFASFSQRWPIVDDIGAVLVNRIVAFVILALFAFANAGVRFSAETFGTLSWRVFLGVALGLWGK
ncbi:MAG TPA: Na+/H+ antiporter NhaA [Gemmatimonadaceae bacterium]